MDKCRVVIGIIFLFNIITSSTCASYHNSHFAPGRSAIVHLFEWKWNDIADECERFLAPYGFAGVQVSPVTENLIEVNRPWWERYQPISYKIITRSGNENEFQSMVDRCNKVGVRIYVDIIMNHMTAKKGSIIGTGGSTANVDQLDYPAVPYGPDDFHANCEVKDYFNTNEVRNCRLVGLPDLDQGRNNVRQQIKNSLNQMIDMGIAGFRVDAAKHMWPSDLEAIYGSLNNLNTKYFPENSRPFIYQEVSGIGDEAIKRQEYTYLGPVTEFHFSHEIGKCFKGGNKLKYLRNWGPEWNMVPSADALVFVDNHDNQRDGNQNGDVVTYKIPHLYVMAQAFMLAHPYGTPQVMSSFHFSDSYQGPPADENGNIISPKINGENQQCENGWVCEHRWLAIRNMIEFRNVVDNAPLNSWWDNDNNQIAFCRGNRGFIAFNIENNMMNQNLFTCLPSGIYCDIITGQKVDGRCTGKEIRVDGNGRAQIQLRQHEVLAIHV